MVFHPHHRESGPLFRQAYGYGAGLTAYLTKVVIDRPWLLLDIARRLPWAARYILSSGSPKNQRRPADIPPSLIATERAGVLASDNGGLTTYASNRGFAHRQVAALLVVNIDHFKLINEQFGRAAGAFEDRLPGRGVPLAGRRQPRVDVGPAFGDDAKFQGRADRDMVAQADGGRGGVPQAHAPREPFLIPTVLEIDHGPGPNPPLRLLEA